jgi:hypothetical protein
MYLGASCVVTGAILRLMRTDLPVRKQSLWLSAFLVGIIFLCGTCMLGVIWGGCALLVAFFLIPRERLFRMCKAAPGRVTLTVVILAVLGVYFMWTLRIGARSTSPGTTDWRSVAFVFYEQLGLLGLGPARTDLRTGGIQLLRPYAGILLTASVLIGFVLINGFLQMAKGKPAGRTIRIVFVVAAFALFLFTVGVTVRWRVLGRHCAGLMPGWIALLAVGLADYWRRPGLWGKTMAIAYIALTLWSCLSIRFASRHARDDYRDAAKCANLALENNQVVWWNAAEPGAQYYNVPLRTEATGKNAALLLINPQAQTLALLSRPNVIITSKPDLYDNDGTVAEYVRHGHYRSSQRFPAFTVWQE